jgi:enoyl-CoA hydratase/carnithine racemase
VARATEILLLGERLSAGRAHELGLVNEVVPGAGLGPAVARFTERLLALPTAALGAQKSCLEFGLRHDLAAALDHELGELLGTFTTDDWHEAIRAFAEKRPPNFLGR